MVSDDINVKYNWCEVDGMGLSNKNVKWKSVVFHVVLHSTVTLSSIIVMRVTNRNIAQIFLHDLESAYSMYYGLL